MADFTIKENDLLPEIQYQLQDSVGNIDLTTATGVLFIMSIEKGTPNKVSAAATIVTPATGIVKYVWTGTDTDTPGDYQAEWEITFPGTKKLTVPNDGYISIEVMADLNSEID